MRGVAVTMSKSSRAPTKQSDRPLTDVSDAQRPTNDHMAVASSCLRQACRAKPRKARAKFDKKERAPSECVTLRKGATWEPNTNDLQHRMTCSF